MSVVTVRIPESEADVLRDVLKRRAPTLVHLVVSRELQGEREELETVVEALFEEYAGLGAQEDAGTDPLELIIDDLIGRITHRLIEEFGSWGHKDEDGRPS